MCNKIHNIDTGNVLLFEKICSLAFLLAKYGYQNIGSGYLGLA